MPMLNLPHKIFDGLPFGRRQICFITHQHHNSSLVRINCTRPFALLAQICCKRFSFAPIQFRAENKGKWKMMERWLKNETAHIVLRMNFTYQLTHNISQKHKWWNCGHISCDFQDFLYQTSASSKLPFINSKRPLKNKNQTPFGYAWNGQRFN